MSFGYQVLGFGSGGVAVSFVTATGGTITTVCTDYKVHTFTGPGTFCVSDAGSAAGSSTVDYMVVAGGGGSAAYYGSAGGGGGYRESPGAASGCYTASPLGAAPAVALPVSVQGYPIAVGGGGAASNYPPLPNLASPGGVSTFSSITSAGGAGGSGYNSAINGQDGGSGSGGSNGGCGGAGNTPPVNPAQGNPGQSTSPAKAGNGGGAILAGLTAGGGAGAGTGINPSACVGTPGPCGSVRYFSGGGGGNTAPIAGGVGGGGGSPSPTAGATNTGGGAANEGAIGGSGIVIIRYKFQ